MGAVGLNFGSPTSGQGFDVSAAVGQIVTNLQSVEKPWKDQLTALQSEDTALSSLGTQFSTLTSDLQALTDFNGTMAYKTGSSSNMDVLHLSSASANAVAGTHTVVVQNLAQVSTAATDAVKATDAIAGSLTFKIGTGEWKTVHVGDALTDSTIAGLSAAINNASLGLTASVLTNADGTATLSLVSKTDGSAGQITIADSTNNPTSPTTLSNTTTADTNANLGLAVIQNGIDATMKVDGVSVTSASNNVTNAIPGVTFQLLSTGTTDQNATPPSIQVVIDNDTSSIETAVAKLVTDYNATIKAINAQEGKDSSGNPEPLYGTGVAAQIQEGLLMAVSASFGTSAINSLIALGITAHPNSRWHDCPRCRQVGQRVEQQLRPGCLTFPGLRQLRLVLHGHAGKFGNEHGHRRSDRPCSEREQEPGIYSQRKHLKAGIADRHAKDPAHDGTQPCQPDPPGHSGADQSGERNV
jgi:flagellar hook-associated protein 2